MIRVIGLFFPACISLAILHRWRKEEYSFPRSLLQYCVFTLVNVWATEALITYGLGMDDVMVTALDSFPFFTKYVLMSMGIAALTPYLYEVLRKYISVRVEIEKKETDKNQKR